MTDHRLVNVCFHGIGEPSRELEPGEARYWITPRQFHLILDEIATWPSLRISFDDGNRSDIEYGLPALVERGLTATFFVLAGRLASPGSLDAAAVVELRDAGMTIGTHGMNHRQWRGLDPTTRHQELVGARQEIAEVAGCPINQAALPLGQYDRRLLSHLKQLGYQSVHTSDRRVARATGWLQPRFSVRTEDSPTTMREHVTAADRPARRMKLTAVGMAKRIR